MAAWRYKKRNFISPRGYVIISAMSKTVLCTIMDDNHYYALALSITYICAITHN